MDQIVQAIDNLHSRDWVDYLAIFAPFVLSIVAVWVSMSTARQQNRIAMFDKRYELYKTFQEVQKYTSLICRTQFIHGHKIEEFYFSSWNASFAKNINTDNMNEYLSISYNELMKHTDLLRRHEFLYSKLPYKKALNDFIDLYEQIVIDASVALSLDGKFPMESVDELKVKASDEIINPINNYMANQLKL